MVRREDRHCRKVFRQESTGELDITVEESAGVGMECKACGAMLEVSEVRDIGRGGEWHSEEYRKVGKCATTIDNINKLCVFDAKETGLFWSNVVCSDRQVDQAFGISGEEGPGRVFEEEVTQDEGGKGATFDEVPYSDL